MYGLSNNLQAAMLIAQCIWYFIEGVNFRVNDENCNDKKFYNNYQVPIDDTILHFKKSLKSGRSWIKLPKSFHIDNNTQSITLLPFSYYDYAAACTQKLLKFCSKSQLIIE